MRLLLLVALVVVLVVTNPGPDDFTEFAEETVAERVGAELGEVPAGGLLGDLGGLAAGQLVRRLAHRDNYLVASVYTLDFDGRARAEEDWRFLGIAGLFFEIDRPDSF